MTEASCCCGLSACNTPRAMFHALLLCPGLPTKRTHSYGLVLGASRTRKRAQHVHNSGACVCLRACVLAAADWRDLRRFLEDAHWVPVPLEPFARRSGPGKSSLLSLACSGVVGREEVVVVVVVVHSFVRSLVSVGTHCTGARTTATKCLAGASRPLYLSAVTPATADSLHVSNCSDSLCPCQMFVGRALCRCQRGSRS